MATNQAFGDQMLRGMLLVTLCAACLWVLAPFLGLVAWAAILAIVLAPVYRRLDRLLGLRRWLTLVVASLVLTALVVVPVVELAAAAVDALDWVRELDQSSLTMPAAPEWLAGLPVAGHWLVEKWEMVRGDLESAASELVPVLRDIGVWLLQSVALAGVALLVVIAALVFALVMLFREQQISPFIARLATRIADAEGAALIDLVVRTVRSVFLGVVGTALLQGLLVAAGLAVAGVPVAAVLGFIAFVAAVAQLPTILVWAPAAVWLGLGDDTVAAIGLALWGLLVVNSVDNFLRPYIISSGAKLPLSLIFIGVIGGLLQFGFVGLFVGPVLLGVGHRLFVHWIEQHTNG